MAGQYTNFRTDTVEEYFLEEEGGNVRSSKNAFQDVTAENDGRRDNDHQTRRQHK